MHPDESRDPKRTMNENYYVYMMSNKPRGTIYIGMTHDIAKRVSEHKSEIIKGFTSRYKLKKLVYYEYIEGKWNAADRERKLKNWHRDWKIDLIETHNPEWQDLYKTLF